MKQLFLLILSVAFLASCQSRDKNIQGVWQTDSITTYVNGFSFTNNTADAHWSQFEYTADGKLLERRKDEFRTSFYKFSGADSLAYADSTGYVLSNYQIVHLDDKTLVLKKSRKPYLAGKNQELYEIRYFSKLPANRATALK